METKNASKWVIIIIQATSLEGSHPVARKNKKAIKNGFLFLVDAQGYTRAKPCVATVTILLRLYLQNLLVVEQQLRWRVLIPLRVKIKKP